MKKILTIAGSDPSGGAGLTKDLLTISELGAQGLSVVAAVTSQNTLGVQDSLVLPAKTVFSQINSIYADLKPDAVKTGMLGSRENVKAVYGFLKKEKAKNLVVDPVIYSSSGYRLLDESAIPELMKLVKISAIATPNVPEAEALSGLKIDSIEDKRRAAEKIGDCVITGGDEDAKDLAYIDGEFIELAGTKRDVSVHGTGCMFSAAVAVYLAYGEDTASSIRKAKTYVTRKIDESRPFGGGLRLAVTTTRPQEKQAIKELQSALKALVSSKESIKLAPEVGMNLVYALPGASSVSEVFGLEGRIVRASGRLVPVGTFKKAGSSHVARVVLTALKADPKKRSAMNIRYSKEAVKACLETGLTASPFDREKQPQDTATMEWGTMEAIKKKGFVPDAVFDEGSKGKEAMIRLIAENPRQAVDKALKIAEKI